MDLREKQVGDIGTSMRCCQFTCTCCIQYPRSSTHLTSVWGVFVNIHSCVEGYVHLSSQSAQIERGTCRNATSTWARIFSLIKEELKEGNANRAALTSSYASYRKKKPEVWDRGENAV